MAMNTLNIGFSGLGETPSLPAESLFGPSGRPAPIDFAKPTPLGGSPLSARDIYMGRYKNSQRAGGVQGTRDAFSEMLGMPEWTTNTESFYTPKTATAEGRASIRAAAAARKAASGAAAPVASAAVSATDAAAATVGGASKAKASFASSMGRGFGRGLRNAYMATSALTKTTLGATVGQMGAAGLLLGGAGLAMASLAFDDPAYQAGRATGAVASFHRGLKAATRPTYGSSAFNQSTQGLVFGLHNGRTAY